MNIRCIWEHNGADTLLYAQDYPGAYTRGRNLDEAIGKMDGEIRSYARWAQVPCESVSKILIVQDCASSLAICEADSDVIFESERKPLSMEGYLQLKNLALKSAQDFQSLFDSVPDKDFSALSSRNTFYGPVPRTAREMYEHTKSVNDYYFGEIGVETDHEGSIAECRRRGFDRLEKQPDFLLVAPCEGSYGEEWSLAKVLRRFLWHDRIHARAMWRMACSAFGKERMENPFFFGE